MSDTYYYGWIPILTYELHFDYFYSNFTRKKTKITEDEQNTLDKKLSKTNGTYYTHKVYEDVKNKEFKAVVSFNDKKIVDHILIFNKENNLEAHAIVHDVGKKGLIVFQLKYPEEKYAWKEHEMANQFYIIIRDVYHHHTHHEAHEDLLLKPIIAKDKKDAIGKILNQYDEKIINYLKKIKPGMYINHIDFAEDLIVASKGEMTYASYFINLFKEDVENHEARSFVFSNALQSINILANKIEVAYTAGLSTETTKLTHLITRLTLAIVALTAPISIDAVFKISEHTLAIIQEHIKTQIILDIINFIPILWIFLCLLILIVLSYKSRGLIKEILEKSYKKSSKL